MSLFDSFSSSLKAKPVGDHEAHMVLLIYNAAPIKKCYTSIGLVISFSKFSSSRRADNFSKYTLAICFSTHNAEITGARLFARPSERSERC